MELLETIFSEVDLGKSIIENAINKRDVEQFSSKVILLFPDNDPETLIIAYKYFKTLMNDYDCAVIITSINIDDIRKQTDKKVFITQINAEDMLCVLRYASMVSKTITAIKIMSLAMPYNQKAKSLVGFKDINYEKIVCRCLYNIFGKL